MPWKSNSTISREERSHGYKTPILSSGEKKRGSKFTMCLRASWEPVSIKWGFALYSFKGIKKTQLEKSEVIFRVYRQSVSQTIFKVLSYNLFFCNLNSQKNFTCLTGNLGTEFTYPITKSRWPSLHTEDNFTLAYPQEPWAWIYMYGSCITAIKPN